MTQLLSFLLNPRIPLWRYSLTLFPIAFIPSILLLLLAIGLFTALGVDIESLKGPEHPASLVMFFAYVVFAPLVETWLLGLMLGLLTQATQGPAKAAAIASLLWGIAHGLTGWLRFFGSTWSFFIFACAFLAWRERSYRQAFAAAAIPHALINLSATLLIAAGIGD